MKTAAVHMIVDIPAGQGLIDHNRSAEQARRMIGRNPVVLASSKRVQLGRTRALGRMTEQMLHKVRPAGTLQGLHKVRPAGTLQGLHRPMQPARTLQVPQRPVQLVRTRVERDALERERDALERERDALERDCTVGEARDAFVEAHDAFEERESDAFEERESDVFEGVRDAFEELDRTTVVEADVASWGQQQRRKRAVEQEVSASGRVEAYAEEHFAAASLHRRSAAGHLTSDRRHIHLLKNIHQRIDHPFLLFHLFRLPFPFLHLLRRSSFLRRRILLPLNFHRIHLSSPRIRLSSPHNHHLRRSRLRSFRSPRLPRRLSCRKSEIAFHEYWPHQLQSKCSQKAQLLLIASL